MIKLAPAAGIELDENLTPAEKLKVVQKLMEADDTRAQKVFRDIGIYSKTISLFRKLLEQTHQPSAWHERFSITSNNTLRKVL